MQNECTLCPRNCRVNRRKNRGFCGAGGGIYAARACIHKWEEPCISGDGKSGGSGAIFFSNCQLKCPFCQNSEISARGIGKEISVSRLCEIMLKLQLSGAYNINLVSPTPYLPQIKEAVKRLGNRLEIPVAVNSGGYESAAVIRELCGFADIFMPDVKFFSPALSKKYLKAQDYFEKASDALAEMIKIAGKPVFDSRGIMQSGVIVRHLVMPGCKDDSIQVLRQLYKRFGSDNFLVSIMSQYLPCGDLSQFPELRRRITTYEYKTAVKIADELGFEGYTQQRSAADEQYIPKWDLYGL